MIGIVSDSRADARHSSRPSISRHHDVEDDEAGQLLLERAPRLQPGAVQLDRIALAAQREAHGLADVVLVVDHGDDGVGWTHGVILVGGRSWRQALPAPAYRLPATVFALALLTHVRQPLCFGSAATAR